MHCTMKEYIRSEYIKRALANLPQLVLEVTDACNLRCKYCAYGELYEDYDKRDGNKMDFAMAKRLIDYLYRFWTSEEYAVSKGTFFVSFYGGEPLMNMPMIKQVVEYVRALEIPRRHIRFSMTSNALLLDKYMDYLVKHEFSLLISLDGNARNDSYRIDCSGHPSFDRVIRNLNLLRDRYPSYFFENVNFNSVLHDRNSVEEIYEFVRGQYGKIPNISELNNVGVKQEKRQEFESMFISSRDSMNESKKKEEMAKELFMRNSDYRSLALFLRGYSGFYYDDYTDLLFDKGNPPFIPTGTCIPFTRKLYLSVNGKILPCERIGQQFALGSVTDSEVLIDVEHIARECNKRLARMEKRCLACYNKKACSQCMYNLEGIDETPKCQGFMDKAAFRSYCESNMLLIRQSPSLYRKIMSEVISS